MDPTRDVTLMTQPRNPRPQILNHRHPRPASLSLVTIRHTISDTSWGRGVSAIQGQKLRQLLEKHGSFKELEMHVKKYVRELDKEGKKGRWVTKQYLTDIMKYSKLLGWHPAR